MDRHHHDRLRGHVVMINMTYEESVMSGLEPVECLGDVRARREDPGIGRRRGPHLHVVVAVIARGPGVARRNAARFTSKGHQRQGQQKFAGNKR